MLLKGCIEAEDFQDRWELSLRQLTHRLKCFPQRRIELGQQFKCLRRGYFWIEFQSNEFPHGRASDECPRHVPMQVSG